MPVKCDTCGLRLNAGISGRCINISCPKESPLNWLQFFVSSDAMDLDFTKEELGALVRSGVVSSPADLFLITTADIKLYIPATDDRARLLRNRIDNARAVASFPITLFSLAIPTVTEARADMVWRKYHSLYDVASATVDELVGCGLDVLTSEYIVDTFERPEILELLIRLEGAGIPMAYPKWQRAFQPPITQAPTTGTGSKGSGIRGKCFVFTGKLSTLTRAGAEAEVTRLGGHFQSAINSMTDYLVTGDRVGSVKTNAARKQGVTILTEAEYNRMVNS